MERRRNKGGHVTLPLLWQSPSCASRLLTVAPCWHNCFPVGLVCRRELPPLALSLA